MAADKPGPRPRLSHGASPVSDFVKGSGHK